MQKKDYYYSSNLRAHGVCDYGTLPIMRQDLSSYLTTYIYKYIRPFRMVFFCLVTDKLSNCLLRSRDLQKKENIEIYKYRNHQNGVEVGLLYGINNKFYR